MKNKRLLSLISLILAGSVVTACGGGESKTTEPEKEPQKTAEKQDDKQKETDKPAGQDRKITFGFWGDTKEAEMKMKLAEEFKAKNPGLEIDFEYTDGAGYLTKLQTWITSNTVPDVFGVASDNLFQFMGNPAFEDLSGYVKKDDLMKVWNETAMNANYVEDGKVYAVPFISKVFAMAYNKDLFDKAGIPYPDNEWTETQMLEYAEKLTQGEGADKVYGIRWGVRPTEFYRNLYGDPVYDIKTKTMNARDNKQFKHAVSMFADTISKGWAPNETSGAISTGGFETGKFAMQLTATWDIATYQSMIGDSFDWDIVILPKNEEFNSHMLTTYRGNGWSMSASSEEKDIAWEFIKYMCTDIEAQKAAQGYGLPEYLPYASSDEYMKDFGGSKAYNKQVFIDMLDHTTSFYNLGVYAQINDVIKNQYELLLAGQTTVDQLAEEVQTQGESLLASE